MPAAVTTPAPGAVLTLDAALDGCSAAVVLNGTVVAEARHGGGRGSAAILPELARGVLAQAGLTASSLRLIAVTVGPGSFTGVRAALALALGTGLAADVPVMGVTVGEALRAVAPDDRPVWVAVDSRRGRVFLDVGGIVSSVALPDLPLPSGPVAVAGDAAGRVAELLLAQGASVRLLPQLGPEPLGIARGAARAARDAVPLYVDPVEARPSAAPRPAPA